MIKTYHSKTLKQIKSDELFKQMHPMHQNLYIENCLYVIQHESAGMNLDYCQLVRNSNFYADPFLEGIISL